MNFTPYYTPCKMLPVELHLSLQLNFQNPAKGFKILYLLLPYASQAHSRCLAKESWHKVGLGVLIWVSNPWSCGGFLSSHLGREASSRWVRPSSVGVTGTCTVAGDLWEVAESSPVLKKWVLKNKQDLAYAGMKQELDVALGSCFLFCLVENRLEGTLQVRFHPFESTTISLHRRQ